MAISQVFLRRQRIPWKGEPKMRDYELTFIAKPDLDSTNLNAVVERVKGFVAADGGTVAKTDMWGLRHMTYPIKKYRDGQYVHMQLKMEGSTVARVEQRMKLVEDVIRYLLVSSEDDAATPDVMDSQPAETPATESAAA
jgi:small subunit ribosomal protein S6